MKVYKYVLTEDHGSIVKLILNRPEKRNAQNEELINQLDEAFKSAENNDKVRVIIIAGEGPSFSSGHDMMGGLDLRLEAEHRWTYEEELFFQKCMTIWDSTKVTIAQVQGHCLAAGLMLANSCDLIVASEDAQFGDPVVKRLASPAVEILSLPWFIGIRKTKEMLFTGEYMNAEEAKMLGMVNQIVPREKLDETTMNLAKKIASSPPFALKLTKRSINRMLDIAGFRVALESHFDLHVMGHFSKEMEHTMRKLRETTNLKEFLTEQDNK